MCRFGENESTLSLSLGAEPLTSGVRPSWEDYKIEQIPSIQWHVLLSRRPQNGEEVRFLQLLAFVIAAPRTAERNKIICSNDSRTPICSSERPAALATTNRPSSEKINNNARQQMRLAGGREAWEFTNNFHVQGLILKMNK